MATSKAKVKRRITKDMKRAMTPRQAKEAITEIAQEIADEDMKPELTSAAAKVPPGTVIGDTKVIYTFKDLEAMFPIVTFTPEVTIPLSFNGVRFQALEGRECHVPKCFKDIYDKVRKPRTEMRQELAGMGIRVEPGAGKVL
jgi:hypothetical protein